MKMIIKFFLSFCLFCLFIQTSFAQNNNFYDLVLNDFRGNSAFIALNIISNEYNGRVIIENGDLYVLLFRAKGFDEKAYKSFMKDLLQNDKKLCLCDADFKNIRVRNVNEPPLVKEYAKKGREKFIENFFINIDSKNFMGLEKFSLEERSAVINQLFEWKIASFIDDESGYLVIQKN